MLTFIGLIRQLSEETDTLAVMECLCKKLHVPNYGLTRYMR